MKRLNKKEQQFTVLLQCTHILHKPQAEGRGDPLSSVDPTVNPHGLLIWLVVHGQLGKQWCLLGLNYSC